MGRLKYKESGEKFKLWNTETVSVCFHLSHPNQPLFAKNGLQSNCHLWTTTLSSSSILHRILSEPRSQSHPKTLSVAEGLSYLFLLDEQEVMDSMVHQQRIAVLFQSCLEPATIHQSGWCYHHGMCRRVGSKLVAVQSPPSMFGNRMIRNIR